MLTVLTDNFSSIKMNGFCPFILKARFKMDKIFLQVIRNRPSAKKSKQSGKKKLALKFVIDCTHPVEDGILEVADFVSEPHFVTRFVFPSLCTVNYRNALGVRSASLLVLVQLLFYMKIAPLSDV